MVVICLHELFREAELKLRLLTNSQPGPPKQTAWIRTRHRVTQRLVWIQAV